MSNFKSDNPDRAKGTPATEKSEREKSSLDQVDQGKAPPNMDPETKEACILAPCIASLCCCFAAGGVASLCCCCFAAGGVALCNW
ncbi:hypothetical protein CsSME_00009895 [Camellia sinensis var. sinensis]